MGFEEHQDSLDELKKYGNFATRSKEVGILGAFVWLA